MVVPIGTPGCGVTTVAWSDRRSGEYEESCLGLGNRTLFGMECEGRDIHHKMAKLTIAEPTGQPIAETIAALRSNNGAFSGVPTEHFVSHEQRKRSQLEATTPSRIVSLRVRVAEACRTLVSPTGGIRARLEAGLCTCGRRQRRGHLGGGLRNSGSSALVQPPREGWEVGSSRQTGRIN